MKKEMHEIHQEVFDYLMKKHKEDENFLFTVRQINRGGRLDKGYWFLGNDHYLAVSFWAATNWKRRTPNIFIVIDIEGGVHFELATSDSEKKTDFVQKKIVPVVQELITEPINRKLNKWKFTESSGKNFIEVLELFLEEGSFKQKIDRAIKENAVINKDAKDWEKIDFLKVDDFKKNIVKIRKYQSAKNKKKHYSRYMKSISIEGFSPIKHIEISNIPGNCKWIVLTGENGSGKTTLLKAIASALSFNHDNGKSLTEKFGYNNFKINIKVNDWNKKILNYNITPKTKARKRLFIPNGFSSYGAIRLIGEGTNEGKLLCNDHESAEDYTSGIFKNIGILKDLSSFDFNGMDKKQIELHSSIVNNLSYIIPNVSYIDTDIIDQLVFYQYFGETEDENGVSFEQLPSGTKSIVGLILDLLIRFKKQQPNITDPADYAGIVLIDEIDIHLHPKMQVEIVKQLSETFPKIQFIVSTHSPIPLLGMPDNSVFCKVSMDYKKGVCVERLDINISDLLPNTILSSPIFGFTDFINFNHKENKLIRTENNYDEVVFQKILEKKIKERTFELGLDDD